MVRFANIGEMHRCKQWLEDEDNFALVKAHFDSTSRFALSILIMIKLLIL